MIREILQGLGIISGTRRIAGDDVRVFWHGVPKAEFLPGKRKHTRSTEVGPPSLIVLSPVDKKSEERPAGRIKLAWWR
jgi:hypothetical protein